MKLDIYRRVPNSEYRIPDSVLNLPFEWVADWACPNCERQTVEMFGDTEPTAAQLEAIQADPTRWLCRHKQLNTVQLSLIRP